MRNLTRRQNLQFFLLRSILEMSMPVIAPLKRMQENVLISLALVQETSETSVQC